MNEEDQVAKLFDKSLVDGVKKAMEVHLSQSDDDPHRLAGVLMDRAFLQEWAVYDQPKDLEALSRLDAAVSEIERLYYFGLTQAASDNLGARMVHGPHYDGLMQCEITLLDSDAGRDLLAYHSETGQQVTSALSSVEEFSAAIRDAIAKTKDDIMVSERARKSTARINLVGIQLVEAARFVWELSGDNKAPTKDLNTASAFGAFLADVFEACEVQGDVRSAFRAWAKESAVAD
ncbi:hypothetical protein [Pontivivens nitratireducens]|uniref:hypothetical protein n=1 Tax=Pontivivens nitratireducens TaxID=2758038 RepID=UPI001639B5D6|nr:hypothetical protein [Pontibrevibacter nitratireducens]